MFVYCDCHYLSMHSPNLALLSQITWSLILFAVGSCLTLQPSPFNHHSTERVAGQCNVWFCSVWLPMGVEGRSLCQPIHSSSSPAVCVPRQGWCPELHCSTAFSHIVSGSSNGTILLHSYSTSHPQKVLSEPADSSGGKEVGYGQLQ